jgi:hypothetical protein
MVRGFGAPACLAIVMGALGGCAAAPAADGSDLSSFVVARVPDTATKTFVDFGSKVQLVGYEFTPSGSVAPGGALKATLYWKRVGGLDPEWSLFTHVDDDRGRQIRNYDRVGGFRTALVGNTTGLSRLELGKIYADEQTVEIPRGRELTPKIVFVVGVWQDKVRLPVLSGTANGSSAAVVGAFSTGVQRSKPAAVPTNGTKAPSK